VSGALLPARVSSLVDRGLGGGGDSAATVSLAVLENVWVPLMQAFEMHRLLTGREEPSMVVFSNILWDLGRWLFLSEIAEPDR
jgi:hypothetical protein